MAKLGQQALASGKRPGLVLVMEVVVDVGKAAQPNNNHDGCEKNPEKLHKGQIIKLDHLYIICLF